MASPHVELNGSRGDTPQIIDIRSDTASFELRKHIVAGLHPANGEEKTLPTLLLYDDKGLKLFEDITYLEQYYLTGQEIRLLEQYAGRIAERIPEGALIVELGSGNLRKVKILLDALERSKKKATYYALDLMHDELVRTFVTASVASFKYVTCAGLWGTYDDGLAWLKRPENAGKPKAILSMGSSIGNFTPDDAAGFLSQFAVELNPGDLILLALDGCQDSKRVYEAYNDSIGTTHRFTSNGLEHANRVLGYKAFDPDSWEAIGHYDPEGSRHQAFVAPKSDFTVEGAHVKKGERIRIEESYKYSWERTQALTKKACAGTSVIETAWFANQPGDYFIHLLSPSKNMIASSNPERYAAQPVPSVDEWRELWSFWDLITRQMIPESELLAKPIKLRNACIFYLGHIPTFFDMKITEATNGQPTEPQYFYKIFERGIDPDVDNPEKVHAHSEVPDTWPDLKEILEFQDRVRERVLELYKSGEAYKNTWLGRALWLGFEHEAMHLETLLYMLVQSDKTLPPKTSMKPDWSQAAAQAERSKVENQWFDIPEQDVQIGLDDPENADGPARYFGWDVEKPAYNVRVKAFKAKARPISNGEYAKFLLDSGSSLPASWTETHLTNGTNGVNGYTNGYHTNGSLENGHHTNGHTENAQDAALDHFVKDKAVRTVHGLVPLKYALHWPVAASYDELSACAKFMGGRIPTLEEARSIYMHADALKKKEAANALGKKIPAVNSHLVNEGVEETPPSEHLSNGSAGAHAGPDPNVLFADLEDANVGFKRWHPVPVTHRGNKLAGLGEMGGLWEWTSTTLERIPGFEPMKLYPAYSADFYDDKHNVVLGGSWATHPRVAGRKTFVNWYQRNYPYVSSGARLVTEA